MGIFDKAMGKALGSINVEDFAAKLAAAVQDSLNKQGHTQHAGWTGTGSWFVECLNAECDFAAQGSSGGKLGCDKMAELHLMELKDA